MSKVAFDTLKYAKIFEQAGITHSDIYTSSLSDILVQNMYSKNEIDIMIDNMAKYTERTLAEMKLYFEKLRAEDRAYHDKNRAEDRAYHAKNRAEDRAEHIKTRADFEKEILRVENKIMEVNNQTVRRLTINMGIMCAILTTVSSLLHFVH